MAIFKNKVCQTCGGCGTVKMGEFMEGFCPACDGTGEPVLYELDLNQQQEERNDE